MSSPSATASISDLAAAFFSENFFHQNISKMYMFEDKGGAIALMLAALVFLGTWPAVLMLLERRGRLPQHTYLDYSITNLLAAILIALTFGQIGDSKPDKPNFFTQLSQDNWPSVLFAMAGGVVLSLGNLSTQYAWAYVGLSVTEVITCSITVIDVTMDAENGNCFVSDPKSQKTKAGTAEYLIELENRRSIKVLGSNTFLGLGIVFFAGICFSLFSPAFNLATNDQWHVLKKGMPHLVVYTAFFYFSVSCFVLAVALNTSFLYRPILGLPRSSLKAYLNDWNGRQWALLAGLLCGFGNGLQFMGGQAAGYAAADAVQRKWTGKDRRLRSAMDEGFLVFFLFSAPMMDGIRYCMCTLLCEVPEGWRCEDCLRNAGAGVCSPSTMEEEIASARSSASGKQDMQSVKTSFRKNGDGKVKFITAEEVSILESGLKSSRKGISQIINRRSDSRNIEPQWKDQKNIKSTPVDSKEVDVPLMLLKKPVKFFIDISQSKHISKLKHSHEEKGRETSSQIRKKQQTDCKVDAIPYYSFSEFARPSEAACDFIADSLHDKGRPPNLQDNLLVIEEPSKASLATLEPRDSGTASFSIPQLSKLPSQEMSLPRKLIISPDEKLQHALEPCWRGSFELLGMVMVIHGGVHGYLSCQVSPKVYDISKQLPATLKFKALPRESVWPKIFSLDPPRRNDVALHFFCEEERHKEKYDNFVQRIHSCDYALQGFVADVELLVFSSSQLRSDSEKCGRKIYFCGVFRHVRRKRATFRQEKAISYCLSTPMHHNNDNSKLQVPLHDNSMVVDMEIDMAGGCHIGTVDIPVLKLDAPPGFSKPLRKAPMSFTLKKTDSNLLDTPPGFPLPIYKDQRKQHAGTLALLPQQKNSEHPTKHISASSAVDKQKEDAARKIHR
ncbi:Ureide permease 1 [Apostasia shenzhenica]|uniref:Ureide permease 1 n=1 Tax=Apostasia shenzhenica TaxID=1088818 RepID=A0A2I0A2G2_9ASPA|nr:Ureide permease 1 [Apostasia shenzhenica]